MVAEFIARLLRIWRPHELPEPFHGRVQGVDYDVQSLSARKGGEVSVSISLPRARMLIQPICFRKDERHVPCGRNVGWIIDALFNRYALSVDVGLSGERIEVS